jgi:hypothetical protein
MLVAVEACFSFMNIRLHNPRFLKTYVFRFLCGYIIFPPQYYAKYNHGSKPGTREETRKPAKKKKKKKKP